MAYAIVSDLEARWRPLDTAEKARATALLGDAQVYLDAECPPSAPPTPAELEARKIVSCDMVKRAMIGGDNEAGVSALMNVAGPFTQQRSFANPTAEMYLTKKDRKLLGCGGQRAFMIDTAPPGSGVHPWMESTL